MYFNKSYSHQSPSFLHVNPSEVVKTSPFSEETEAGSVVERPPCTTTYLVPSIELLKT